jgi:hypothetical protein
VGEGLGGTECGAGVGTGDGWATVKML